MAGVLEGIKVLDLASVWAAPSAAVYLADQGADVIKVEPPGGDEARRIFTHPDLGNESPSFIVANRNKKGIVLDMQKPEGREIVHKLADQTDVLIHNYRPNFAKRIGLSYQELEARNPRLIYVWLTAYGNKGPYAEKAGYDLIVQALAGLMHRTAADGTPLAAGVWAADCSAPIGLAYGIALALLARERTGRGQQVQTSLLQMAIAMQHVDLVYPEAEPPAGRAPSSQASFAPYKASDDKWFLPVAISDKEWVKLCRVLEVPHMIDDPAFATSQARGDHVAELFPILEGIYSTKTRDEWLRLLDEGDVPCAPIIPRAEVFSQPQVVENNMAAEVLHPTAGRTKMMGVPVKLSANPPRTPQPSPLQGEHTVEVLKGLGYGDDAIERLRQARVIPGAA